MAQRSFGPGSAENSQGMTFSAFFSSLTISLGIFLVQMTLFLIFRHSLPHIYEPKSLLIAARKSGSLIPSPSPSVFGWLTPLFSVPLESLKTTCTLDEYFFLRFLYFLFFLFACTTSVTLPLLCAINWMSGDRYGYSDYNYSTIDNFSWTNISPKHSIRRTAHLACALALVSFICWLMYFELNEYIKIRHCILSSSSHRQKPSSKTILLRSIPSKYLSENKIKKLFDIFPGCIETISINRDYSPLVKLVKERAKLAQKLECLENYIVWKANRVHRTSNKNPFGFRTMNNVKSSKSSHVERHGELTHEARYEPFFPETSSFKSVEHCSSVLGKKWTKYIKEGDIPKVRLPSFQILGHPIKLPFCGLQIDLLSWYKIELNRINAQIKVMQESRDSFKIINSCFIQFRHQVYAHLICQSIVFENPQLSGESFIEIDPNDINWANLDLSWLQCFIRRVFATILNVLIILGWTFPVAIIAILSQLDYLPELSHGFLWIDYIPARFRIMISAILPSIVVSWLMRIAPIVFRYLARLKGFVSYTEVDLDVQKYLFVFIFIQVFLVISLSRGMTAVVAHVFFSPFSALSLLASNLPKAANFFYSYLFLQGLSLSGDIFLQTGRIIRVYIWRPFIDKTPHQKFSTVSNIGALQLGSIYPNITCLAIIGIVYSIIAPFITLFSMITFGLLYLAFKYRILYCNNPISDSGGLHFPKAVFQLTIGIYCLEGCLAGLFLTTRNQNKPLHISCVGILIAAILTTSILHYRLRSVFTPIIKYMPISSYDATEEITPYQNNQIATCSETYIPPNNTFFSKILSQNINSTESSPKKMMRTTSDSIHSAASKFLLTKHSRSFSSLSSENLPRTRSFSTGNNYASNIYQMQDQNNHIDCCGCCDRIEFGPKDKMDKREIPYHRCSECKVHHTQQIPTNVNNHLVNIPVKYPYLDSVHLSHPALYDRVPCIWVADDELGIASDQSFEIHQNYPYIFFSTDGCILDDFGNVAVNKMPPDFFPAAKFTMYPQNR